MTVGKRIDVGDVVSKSTDLLVAHPSIILISVLPAIPALLFDIFAGSSLFLAAISGLISGILSIIASGAYAPVVKEALAGQHLTIGEALGHAYRRFWSLLAAGILVGIIVFLGFIALIVPGIIFLTWYAYTTPAIMLENKGALEGMSASKAFGRDKKWSTFLLFLVFLLVYAVVEIISVIFSLGGGGQVVQTLLNIPLTAWTSVVVSYTYITHGPSATSEVTQPTSPSSQGPVSSAGPFARFCTNCGFGLQADAKFCPNCGRPV